jgi:hypothetical protein
MPSLRFPIKVVQLYVKQPHASVPVPNVRLGDFERVVVLKGQTVTVTLHLTPDYHSIVPDGVFWAGLEPLEGCSARERKLIWHLFFFPFAIFRCRVLGPQAPS